jgi:pimeloyl-ACP methyl ester carboxylesterase
VGWVQLICELQRDWNREKTTPGFADILFAVEGHWPGAGRGTEDDHVNGRGRIHSGRSGESFRPWLAAFPRAVAAICHGFNAHSGMYAWCGDQFAQKGVASYALDLRGRGKSDGERFYVERFEDYVDDLNRFIKFAKSREPGLDNRVSYGVRRARR